MNDDVLIGASIFVSLIVIMLYIKYWDLIFKKDKQKGIDGGNDEKI